MNLPHAPLSVLVTLLCVACNGESEAVREANDMAAANDHSLVQSCTWENMDRLRFRYLSHSEQIEVCRTIQASLGRSPSVAITRKLSQAVFVIRNGGAQDDTKELAYQIMNIVEVRGKSGSDKDIDDSFEAIAKIFNGTQGHVTPRDMNIFLRNAGPMAKTLSNDGLFGMAAVLWEQKKANGQ